MRVLLLLSLLSVLCYAAVASPQINDHLQSILNDEQQLDMPITESATAEDAILSELAAHTVPSNDVQHIGAYQMAAKLSDAQEQARKLAAEVLPAHALLESSANAEFRPYTESNAVANLHAVAQIKSGNKKKETPLEMAYNAVQSEVMSRVHEINNEKKWINSVTSLISTYSKKHSKVQSHMTSIKKDIRNLLKKKKQIQNAIVQRELKGRVKVTSKDLNAVNTQLRRILKKAQEFKKHQVKLKKLLFRMNRQLNHLRGKSTMKVKKGRKGKKARRSRK